MAIDNRKPKEEIQEEVDEIVNTPEGTPEVETPEEIETPEEVEQPEEKPESTTKPDIDYKEKFRESTREAQVLAAKNRKIVETIDEAAQAPEPTEDELRKEFPEWDTLTEIEQRLFKDNLMNRRKFDLVHSAVQETRKVDEWAGKVDEFLTEKSASEQNPLEGREDEFRSFAMKPTRRGVDLGDLVSAFLYTAEPAKKNRGSLLETATGGPKETKPKELTPDEIKRIRINDPKLYTRLIKEGKIKIDL